MKITELDKRPNVWKTTVTEPDDSEWRNMTLAKPEDMNWEQFSSSGPKTKEEIAAWRQAKQNSKVARPKDHHPDPIKEETDATLDSIVESIVFFAENTNEVEYRSVAARKFMQKKLKSYQNLVRKKTAA